MVKPIPDFPCPSAPSQNSTSSSDDAHDVRVTWSERNPRPGWDIAYTNIGGRADPDVFNGLQPELEPGAQRAVSQAMVAVSTGGARERPDDPDIAYWATVVRKIIQRGTNPVLRHAAIRSLVRPAYTMGELITAIAGCPGPTDIDDSFDLHPTHEAPFWSRLMEAEPRLSRWVTPQAPLEALAGTPEATTSRWVDFIVAFPWYPEAAAIEIDGQGHARQRGVDRERDKLLRSSGLRVRRILGATVHSGDSEAIDRLVRAFPPWFGTASQELLRWVHAPAAAQRLAFGMVTAVEHGFLPPGETWRVRLTDTDELTRGLESVALDLLAAVADVWDLDIVPQRVIVNDTAWDRDASGRFQPSPGEDGATPDVDIWLEAFVPPHAPLPAASDPTIVVRGAFFPVNLTWYAPSSIERRSRHTTDRSDAALHLLLQDIYGYDEFREGQKSAINRLLTGGDTCVLLPTGAGKSLIYQLAGLLRPGVTLVVAPLQSLIDDQARRLEEAGIDRVTGFHSGKTRSKEERARIQEAIASGESLFVFVAPERLQIEQFRHHLQEAAASQLVNLAVVDEAHCVSEWGHQFRTSYLKLGRNLRRFCAGNDDTPPPIVALTATASPRVLDDLLYELGLDRNEPGVLHRPASFDRPNLHYHVVRGDLGAREDNVRHALTEIASSLGLEPRQLAEPNGSDTPSGIIFVPHASSGLGLGLLHYRDLVAKTLDVGPDAIALFAGRKPKELQVRDWARRKADYASCFRQNQLAIMVSTNAFGMGIDKPNIRYTLHVTQPSSIEAYAQEAGRAGRDGKPAFCYLVSSNARSVGVETIDHRRETDTNYAKQDLLIQLANLKSSFPSPGAEKATAKEVFRELLTDGDAGRDVTIPTNRIAPGHYRERENERRDRERALFRLLLLGVIDDYTIDYGADTFKVYLTPLDPSTILETSRDLLTRMTAGNQRFVALLNDLDAAPLTNIVESAIDALVDTLYQTIEPARANALREMYLLTQLTAPEAIREKINAYLSEGPVALILDKVIRSAGELSDALPDLLRELEDAQHSPEEWAGASARYLDAYPDHPVLLLVRALGEAWQRDGSRDEFLRVIEEAAASLPSFGMGGAEQVELLDWVLRQLRVYFRGERWAWAPDIWGALYRSDISPTVVERLEDRALERAQQGDFLLAEVEVIVAERLRRTHRLLKPVVSRLARTG